MSTRLLSLLTEIENAIVANDASPENGTHETSRVINFKQGLARLALVVRSSAGATTARGAILLQNYSLADGSQCVKANLSWYGTESTAIYAIYGKAETNWKGEASQIAIKWLDGQVAAPEAHELPQGGISAGMDRATA